MATKLNFLQYTYRIRINHKTLYSQTFPGPHFGSWTITWWPSLLTHICVTKPRHVHLLVPRKGSCHSKNKFSNTLLWLHQPRLWFITAGYLVKRWFLPAATRARGQSNDLNREILTSNLFNCRKEVINAPRVPSISRCIHIVYRHKNVWEYQWLNFIYNCLSTFLHYVCCKDALLDCSAPGGERCESLTRVDEIDRTFPTFIYVLYQGHLESEYRWDVFWLLSLLVLLSLVQVFHHYHDH